MKLEDEIFQKKFQSEAHKVVVNILFTQSWVTNKYASILKPYGLTLQQYNVLRILRGQSPAPCSIKLIKERMLDKMSDASRIVEKLRGKDFCIREICATDRRNVEVRITKKGLQILSELDIMADLSQKYMSNLSEEELKQLNVLLDKLRN